VSDNSNLSERLGRYSITARGQIARGPSIGEIAGYAAAAGAGLVMAGGADAAVIYSGVRNTPIELHAASFAPEQASPLNLAATPYGVDIYGTSGAEFSVRLNFHAEAAPATQSNAAHTTYYGIGANVIANPAAGAKLLGADSSGSSLNGLNLPAGMLISAGAGNFGASSAGWSSRKQRVGGATGGTGPAGYLTPGATAIVGFMLGNGNYGWIRLLIENTFPKHPLDDGGNMPGNYPDRITVIDWAYATDGDPITAGVPAPAPLALLAAGAVGIAAFRRRKLVPVRAD
jgi:hypothetical protein